jgi:hypothetical protein
MCVPVASFALPIDDPTTPYNESEATTSIAILVNISAAAAPMLEGTGPTRATIQRTPIESFETTTRVPVQFERVSHSLLDLRCALLC